MRERPKAALLVLFVLHVPTWRSLVSRPGRAAAEHGFAKLLQ